MQSSLPRRPRVVEGSCWSCKTKRVKCDLAKPTCRRCDEARQDCDYGAAPPYRWVGGMARRGRHAPQSRSSECSGSSTPHSTASSTDDAPACPSPPRRGCRTSSAPVEAVSAVPAPAPAAVPAAVPAAAAAVPPPAPAPALGPAPAPVSAETTALGSPVALASPIDDQMLVPYFINIVLPRYCLGDFVLSLDLHALLAVDAVQGAVMAIARAHFDMQGKHGSALARSRSRQMAIQTFRRQLASNMSEDAAPDLLATNVLFCMLDGMIEPTQEANASTVHLKGGYAILDQWKCIVPRMICEGGIQSHLLSVFATLDIVHAVLSGCKSYFEPTIFRMMANTETWWGCLEPDNSFLMTWENLCLLAARSNMVYSIVKTYGLQETRKRMAFFGDTLSPPLGARFDYRQGLVENGGGGGGANGAHRKDDWTAFCELFDISARIFYERAIRLREVNDPTVQQYTQHAVSMLTSHCFSGMLQHCLVLPITIIGAHCIETSHQLAISSALSPTVSYLSFGGMVVLEQFLWATWTKGNFEATWWEMFENIAEKIFVF